MTVKSNFIKFIYLIVLALLLVNCSSSREDESEIGDTVTKFYKSLNNGDYKQLESLCSNNMQRDIKFLRENIKSFIEIKKVTIKDIEVNTYTAAAVVECTDVFANKTEMQWDLIKQNGRWKMNNFNFSQAQSLDGKVTSDIDNINPQTDTLNAQPETSLTQQEETDTQNTEENADN